MHSLTTTPRPTPKTVSVPDAARILGVSRTLAYELVARGTIPSIRLGKRIVIPSAALAELLNAHSAASSD